MGNKTCLTISMITAEALRVLEDNLLFTKKWQEAGPEERERLRALVKAQHAYWQDFEKRRSAGDPVSLADVPEWAW